MENNLRTNSHHVPAAGETTPCRECRRRRVKCDGAMPVCGVCQRYGRHCLYDKHSRTRLTRRQLTILEERVEKAEALLRQHFSDEQLAEMMNGAAGAPGGGNLPAGVSSSTPLPLNHSKNTSTERRAGVGSIDGLPADPFEVPPSAVSNFEWNEQEPSWSKHDPSRESGVNATGEEDDLTQTIMDGMATLSVGEHNRGYLGSLSGAALLYRIISARKDGEETVELSEDPQQQTLMSLFQENSSNHSSQWFRTQTVLTRMAVESFIDAFFALYHPTFPIVHEPTFRAQYAGTLPLPNKQWTVLANILAALGSFASSSSSDATDLTIFKEVQKHLFADNLEVGNLTLVQAFALSATYLQKRNKPNSGWNHGGVALRLAIGLGLHKDPEEANISILQKEIRRRIWWCLCVLDVGATITYGRPLNWPQAGVEVSLPRNIHETELSSESTSYPPGVDDLTLYTYIRVQCDYHIQTMNIYNRLITSPFPSAEELVALDDKYISAWCSEIPRYYREFPPSGSKHALGMGISKWRYRQLRIVMYRPFLVRWGLHPFSSGRGEDNSTSAENRAVSLCLDAARETITSIEEFWTSRPQSRLAAWYVLYFLFQAALVPLHCLRQNPQHSLATDWRSQIRSSLAVMDGMAELNPNSSKCSEVTLMLSWPHLQDEDSTHIETDNAAFLPTLEDAQAASMMSSYDMWCELMNNASTGAPLYQQGNVDDQDLNFFL